MTGLQMIERIQKGYPKSEPLQFPASAKGGRVDKQCSHCETVYYRTTREYCPKCDTYSVWPIAEGVKA